MQFVMNVVHVGIKQVAVKVMHWPFFGLAYLFLLLFFLLLYLSICPLNRGLKDMEQEISSIEKRFAYGFLQKLLKWMEIAQEFIAHLGVDMRCFGKFSDNDQCESLLF